MRILMLTSTLPRFPGDSQADFVAEQARAWLEARPDDSITILAPHDPAAERRETHGRLAIERFRYVRPSRWQALAYPAIMPNLRRRPLLAWQVPLFLAAEYSAAAKLVQEGRCELVYAHWAMPQGLVAWRLKRRFGLPFVLQNHSSDMAVFAKLGAPGRRMARTLLREAAHFFCVNQDQRAAALGLLPENERADFSAKCTVLPMGIVPLGEGEIGDDGYDIGTIGRLSRKKGLDHLIAAAELLAAEGLRPRIGIAGDGEERAELMRLVSTAQVDFTGFVTGADKARFMARCARFAFPAKASDGDVEGLPVALLEALSAGRPVLASEDTNVRQLAEWPQLAEEIEFVADPEDHRALAAALKRLLARPAGGSNKAKAAISRYRWDRLIEEYLAPIEAFSQACEGSD